MPTVFKCGSQRLLEPNPQGKLHEIRHDLFTRSCRRRAKFVKIRKIKSHAWFQGLYKILLLLLTLFFPIWIKSEIECQKVCGVITRFVHIDAVKSHTQLRERKWIHIHYFHIYFRIWVTSGTKNRHVCYWISVRLSKIGARKAVFFQRTSMTLHLHVQHETAWQIERTKYKKLGKLCILRGVRRSLSNTRCYRQHLSQLRSNTLYFILRLTSPL